MNILFIFLYILSILIDLVATNNNNMLETFDYGTYKIPRPMKNTQIVHEFDFHMILCIFCM